MVPVLPWQRAGRSSCVDGGALHGHGLAGVTPFSCCRTCCAGVAAQHKCEQGQGASSQNSDLYEISNTTSKCHKLVTSLKSLVKRSCLVRASKWCVPRKRVNVTSGKGLPCRKPLNAAHCTRKGYTHGQGKELEMLCHNGARSYFISIVFSLLRRQPVTKAKLWSLKNSLIKV